jgi:hypothetical protein
MRFVAAAICLLVGLYWLGVSSAGSQTGGGGFRLLVAVLMCFWVAAAVYPLVASRLGTAAMPSAWPVIAISLGVFAALGPWLLNEWVRGDSDRYVWVISHVDPCSGMGGGPGMVWVFGTSWLAAFGALTYAATFRLSVLRVVAGLGLGALLLAATAAAMFPDPAIFARVLGCI